MSVALIVWVAFATSSDAVDDRRARGVFRHVARIAPTLVKTLAIDRMDCAVETPRDRLPIVDLRETRVAVVDFKAREERRIYIYLGFNYRGRNAHARHAAPRPRALAVLPFSCAR